MAAKRRPQRKPADSGVGAVERRPPDTLRMSEVEVGILECFGKALALSDELEDHELASFIRVASEAVKSAIFGRCTKDLTIWTARDLRAPELARDADGRAMLQAARPWVKRALNPFGNGGDSSFGIAGYVELTRPEFLWRLSKVVSLLPPGGLSSVPDDERASAPPTSDLKALMAWLNRYAWRTVEPQDLAERAWGRLKRASALLRVTSAAREKDEFLRDAVERIERLRGSPSMVSNYVSNILQAFGVDSTDADDWCRTLNKG